MLTMLMMGADDDADDRKNYINKLPNSRSTAPRAPNISSVNPEEVDCGIEVRNVWAQR